MSDFKSPLDPALSALRRIRNEVTKRIGKEGGNLNARVLAELDTIEATLLQVVPLGEMMRVLNQQTEVAVNSFRSLERMSRIAVAHQLPENGGDDGTSDTKGQ